MIAALYVQERGTYTDLLGVDPWTESRDARLYAGPHAVVAHPPCERWGRYWFGGPSARVRRVKGDDGGCFAAALAAVRQWGGVLEHPEASHAWAHHGMNKPPKSGGWVNADFDGGWTCCVEQGHYGHPSRKATWLYTVGTELPDLTWGPAPTGQRMDEGFHSAAERRAARAAGQKPVERLSHRQRAATPLAFRDLLLGLARTVTVTQHRNTQTRKQP